MRMRSKTMSDSEYEEEEFLVFADFKSQILSKELSDEKSAIKIIGMESENPVIEVNGNIFKGTYDFAMGTAVFFDKDQNAAPVDPLYEASCRQKYKIAGKTTKVINFQRSYVECVKDLTHVIGVEDIDMSEDPATDENLKLNLTYEEAIKTFPNVNDPQWKEKDLF